MRLNNMELILNPYEGIGNIKIGMTRGNFNYIKYYT